MISCLCGCGVKIPKFDKKFRIRKYLNGHNKGNLNKFKKTRNRNTMYTRSKIVKKPTHCAFYYFNQCCGRYEVHHIDCDITNNSHNNLLNVCTSHHRLIHSKKFNLNKPQKMMFYTDAWGKRRYQHNG